MLNSNTLKNIAPSSCVAIVGAIEDRFQALSPKEKAISREFCQKKIREFSSGRFFAKKALEQLGEPIKELLVCQKKVPAWPKHMTGSISHHADTVGVIVARKSPAIMSIGIDIESTKIRNKNLHRRVMTSKEIQEVQRSDLILEEIALISFSLKESTYKAMAPFGNSKLSFQDIEFSEWVRNGISNRKVYEIKVKAKKVIINRLPQQARIRARIARNHGKIISVVWVSEN